MSVRFVRVINKQRSTTTDERTVFGQYDGATMLEGRWGKGVKNPPCIGYSYSNLHT